MPGSRHSITCCLAFCGGAIAALYSWPFSVPSIIFVPVVLAIAVSSVRFPIVRVPGAVLIGVLCANHAITKNLSTQLQPGLAGTEVQLRGFVASIPAFDGGNAQFLFKPTNAGPGIPNLLRMRWYRDAPAMAANELWQLEVRILPPRGRLNFTGFDFEKWLFARSIGGLGSVRNGKMLEPGDATTDPVLQLRQGISSRIDTLLAGHRSLGLVKALAIGDRTAISTGQWQFLAASGTTHLVAISGMHIGMVALFGFLAGKCLFMLAPAALAQIGSRRLGIVLAMFFAGFYALLSGFVVPAQRALLILLVILTGQLMRRRAGTMHSLLLAATVIILLDPLAPLRIGFWLSFAAVFMLLFAASGKQPQQHRWRQILHAQWVVIVGMTPLTLFWFQQTSLISIPANLVAIPLVSLVVVPTILLAIVLLNLIPAAAGFLLWVSAQLLDGLQDILANIAQLPGILHQVPAPGLAWTLIAVAGVLLLLSPRAIPGRLTGLVLVLPLLSGNPARPDPGTIEMTVLDVGQGNAVLLQTNNQLLLYDTGPGDGWERQVVESTILPAIRSTGVHGPDTIIVSHADLDHSGGMRRLASYYPQQRWYSSLPPSWRGVPGEPCRSPLSWNRDGYEFAVLHPGPGLPYLGNDSSCVLAVTGANAGILLPGDVSEAVEQRLLLTSKLQPVSVLLVPHHGSMSSSSTTFIDQVSPRIALISSGYMNRFNLPKDAILNRYHASGAQVMSTAECGAIRVTIAGSGNLLTETARRIRAGAWRQKAGSSCR